jgi:hypothetical protein
MCIVKSIDRIIIRQECKSSTSFMQQGCVPAPENMTQTDSQTVELRVQPGSLPRFTVLLQSGVEIETTGPCSLEEFLCGLPGFTLDYITNQIQTIFLNGTAVDDLTAPIPAHSPTLALSAAMPGLAGAIFRRNSMHAPLRSKGGANLDPSQNGTVVVNVKLFNMIAMEKGEALLARGVGFRGADLADFLQNHPTLLATISSAKLAGGGIDVKDLVTKLQQKKGIRLIITKDNE